MKKGIILCGGKGTRMLPVTKVVNKHMIPVLNNPMIIYPIKTLVDMGVTDVMIISGGNHIGDFGEFLGDGSEFGVNITYRIQKEAGGIAQALMLAEDFVKDVYNFAVILGDNYFEYPVQFPEGFGLVVKAVQDPQRFGVYYGDRIEEKPSMPKSNDAVTGLYFYTNEIFEFIKTLKPSARGEMEITDVNNWCLGNMNGEVEFYTGFWSDMGTPQSMLNTIIHLHGKSSIRA